MTPAPTALQSPPRVEPPRHATATVGIVGGGQLAQMLHQAAISLGVQTAVLAPDTEAPAALAGADLVVGRPEDGAALERLARASDVVTFDHEQTPLAQVEELVRRGHRVRPGPSAARLAHDKVEARTAFFAHGLPVPPFTTIVAGDTTACRAFAGVHGWPLVAKAPRGGYDGRGVAVLRGPDDVRRAALPGPVWLLEPCLHLAYELAVIVARRPSGETVTYPPVLTTQHDGICHELVMPAPVPDDVAAHAVEIAHRVVEVVRPVGVCAVELFVTLDGRLMVNEIATRPHNSGHATIEACRTSQFENHLRAVLDWPLGDASLRTGATAMVNLLGPEAPIDLADRIPAVLRDPAVAIHLYRKDARPGRKIGHVTVTADDVTDARRRARRAARLLVEP